jgi:cytochrome c2
MNDLLAYIREVSRGVRRERELLPASPAHGWSLFQQKSCILCHSVKGQGERAGPELGPNRKVPLTIVQFAGLMWNHSPQMWQALRARGIARPALEGQEIADLVAFLSSLRYFEPGGSPELGRTVFAERGCSHCHGSDAQGSRLGPPLRGRGQDATSVTLATSLWDHGPSMYKRARELESHRALVRSAGAAAARVRMLLRRREPDPLFDPFRRRGPAGRVQPLQAHFRRFDVHRLPHRSGVGSCSDPARAVGMHGMPRVRADEKPGRSQAPGDRGGRRRAALVSAHACARARVLFASPARRGRRTEVRNVPRPDGNADRAAGPGSTRAHDEHLYRMPPQERRRGRLQ